VPGARAPTLAHRLEAALLGREIGEADLLARVDQKVLADQVLDLCLGRASKGIIGAPHVGELVLAPHEGMMRPESSEYFAGIGRERAVGMPEVVAQLEEPYSILGDMILRCCPDSRSPRCRGRADGPSACGRGRRSGTSPAAEVQREASCCSSVRVLVVKTIRNRRPFRVDRPPPPRD